MALEDPDGQWELQCGHLRQKPGMTVEHTDSASTLVAELNAQLSRREFRVDINGARLRIPNGSFYIPDVVVIPRVYVRRAREERSRSLEVYTEPMPLVVGVWSPSTGDYDVETQLREYRQRGDAEIWLVHPYDRTLTAWRRQADGSYTETVYREGTVEPVSLPGVRIDLAVLFEL